MAPWSLSVDRIDPSRPYTKDNIRFTSKIYNLCRNKYSDGELREAILHLTGTRPYVLRAGESWASPTSRPRRAKGFLRSELAGRANSLDIRQGRGSHNSIHAAWVGERLCRDALFGARLVISPRTRHPLQPSIDRMDPRGAHDQDNSRILALLVNLGLHVFEDSEYALRRLFRLILTPLRNATGGAPLHVPKTRAARALRRTLRRSTLRKSNGEGRFL
jgi:hypothetical protein